MRLAISVNLAEFRNEKGPACREVCGNSATLKHPFIHIEQELRTQTSRTHVHSVWNPIGSWSGFLFLKQTFRQIHACQFPTVYRQEPSERIREWSRGNGAARPRHGPQKSYSIMRIASCLIRHQFSIG